MYKFVCSWMALVELQLMRLLPRYMMDLLEERSDVTLMITRLSYKSYSINWMNLRVVFKFTVRCFFFHFLFCFDFEVSVLFFFWFGFRISWLIRVLSANLCLGFVTFVFPSVGSFIFSILFCLFFFAIFLLLSKLDDLKYSNYFVNVRVKIEYFVSQF